MLYISKGHEHYEEAKKGLIAKYGPHSLEMLEGRVGIPIFLAIQWIKEPSHELLVDAVKNGYNVSRIPNQSNEMNIAAIHNSITNIRLIKNPSDEVISLYNEMVKDEGIPESHEYYEEIKRSVISKLQPNECLDSEVRYYCSKKCIAIEHVKSPSNDFIKDAIRQHSKAFEYIDNPSEEIKKFAITQDFSVIRHIRNPSEKMQKLAVQQNAGAIAFINKPTFDIWASVPPEVTAHMIDYNNHVAKQIENYIACNELVIGKDYEKMPEHHIYKFHDKGHQLSYELITKG